MEVSSAIVVRLTRRYIWEEGTVVGVDGSDDVSGAADFEIGPSGEKLLDTSKYIYLPQTKVEEV